MLSDELPVNHGNLFLMGLGDRSSWSVWSSSGEGPLLNRKMAPVSLWGRSRARELPTPYTDCFSRESHLRLPFPWLFTHQRPCLLISSIRIQQMDSEGTLVPDLQYSGSEGTRTQIQKQQQQKPYKKQLKERKGLLWLWFQSIIVGNLVDTGASDNWPHCIHSQEQRETCCLFSCLLACYSLSFSYSLGFWGTLA